MTIYSKEQLTEYLKNAGFAEIQVHKNEKIYIFLWIIRLVLSSLLSHFSVLRRIEPCAVLKIAGKASSIAITYGFRNLFNCKIHRI